MLRLKTLWTPDDFDQPIRRRFMNRLIAAAFVLGTLVSGANALPLSPVAPVSDSDVIAVAGGCGAGWHRGPYGGCRQNYANPAAHACPRGFYLGPYGRCRANGT
jgi:hypothetical protein